MLTPSYQQGTKVKDTVFQNYAKLKAFWSKMWVIHLKLPKIDSLVGRLGLI